MKKSFAFVGVLLLLAAGAWRLTIAPRFDLRFPDGYTWKENSLGLSGYPEEETGLFPEGTTLVDSPLGVNERVVSASTDERVKGAVRISDHYEVRDPSTNVITWEYTLEALVDSKTGQHLEGESIGDYYLLPRHLDKETTYTISNSSYISLPMTFQREEEVAGINAYIYGYYEPLDNSHGYDGFAVIEEGQSIWCDDFSLEYWVEPITGEIVKYREWCEGDWVVDDASGEQLYPLSRWGGETTGDDLIRRVREIGNLLNQYRMNMVYIPGGLALVGIALLAAGYFSGQAKENNK